MTDKQLVRFATQFRKGILAGKSSASMCWAVAAPLCGLLTMVGVQTVLTEGDVTQGRQRDITNHFWLTLEDGRILDPTADQFTDTGRKLPPVYLGPRPAWYRQAKEKRK